MFYTVNIEQVRIVLVIYRRSPIVDFIVTLEELIDEIFCGVTHQALKL